MTNIIIPILSTALAFLTIVIKSMWEENKRLRKVNDIQERYIQKLQNDIPNNQSH